jgi:alpha-beta hydrolase superfamily lysophospholipase
MTSAPLRQELSTYLTMSDGMNIHCYSWLPSSTPRGLIFFVHGMSEHAYRYKQCAEHLASHGFSVYAHDQRGHGKSTHGGLQGHFADKDGWQRVVEDLHEVIGHSRKIFPGLPVVVIGHSMGSFITHAYCIAHGSELAAAVLLGSNYMSPLLARFYSLIPLLEAARIGWKAKSPVVHHLSFASYNKAFKPQHSEYDWLSRDPAAVQAYIADADCGFRCSNRLWWDLLGGLGHIYSPAEMKKIPSSLPMLLLGGERDPVGAGGGVKKLERALRAAGIRNIECIIYPEARHELLHEVHQQEVCAKLLQWVQEGTHD